MKIFNLRKKICCSAVAFLSLFVLCSSLQAQDVAISFNKGNAMIATIANLPQTEMAATGSTFTFTNQDVSTPGYTIIGWSKIRLPIMTGLHLESKVLPIPMVGFYGLGDTFEVPANDITLYAVWAIDANNDGIADYRPALNFFIDQREWIDSQVNQANNNVSLRSTNLPPWDTHFDLPMRRDSVYYWGCVYNAVKDSLNSLKDYDISFGSNIFQYRAAGNLFGFKHVYADRAMTFVVEYGGVLEDGGLIVGGSKLTEVNLNAGDDLYNLLDSLPFMFDAPDKKDGKATIKMHFYYINAAGDTVHPVKADWAAFEHPSLPYQNLTTYPSGSFPYNVPSKPFIAGGRESDTLSLEIKLYNKPVIEPEIVKQVLNPDGTLRVEVKSGTPITYMMRSIGGNFWERADSPLTGRERLAIGNGVGICFREMDRTIANQQSKRNFFEDPDIFSINNIQNISGYNADLAAIWQVKAAVMIRDSIVALPGWATSHPKMLYDMVMLMPGMTDELAWVTLIPTFDWPGVAMEDISGMAPFPSGGFGLNDPISVIMNDFVYDNWDAKLTAYGLELAEMYPMPGPCRSEIYCLQFEGAPPPPVINRMITLPQAQGIVTNPSAGIHSVRSRDDFTFEMWSSTAGYSLNNVQVTTDQNNVVVIESAGQNQYGSDVVRVTVRYVNAETVIRFGDVVAGEPAPQSTRVWSYDGKAHFNLPTSMEVSIYTVSGMLFDRSILPAGNSSIQLPAGFYIIRANQNQWKVVIN